MSFKIGKFGDFQVAFLKLDASVELNKYRKIKNLLVIIEIDSIVKDFRS